MVQSGVYESCMCGFLRCTQLSSARQKKATSCLSVCRFVRSTCTID